MQAVNFPLHFYPTGTPNRDINFADKSDKFDKHATKLANTARLVATAGTTRNKRTVEAIHAAAQQVKPVHTKRLQKRLHQQIGGCRITVCSLFYGLFTLPRTETGADVDKTCTKPIEISSVDLSV